MSGSQKKKTSLWPQYMSLSCHKACKRSLILKLRSWISHGKVMEKILKFSEYSLAVNLTTYHANVGCGLRASLMLFCNIYSNSVLMLFCKK